jgi:hypothetical protein
LGAVEPAVDERPFAALKAPSPAVLEEIPTTVLISKPLLRLNVLVMGEAGIGKSAFIENLLMELNKSAATALL